jgi:hypothetical protein
MNLPKDNEGHQLLKLYWGLILVDACLANEIPPTAENKRRLHEAHKKIYRCKSISGQDVNFLSDFINEIVGWYASEMGYFIRTSGSMPPDINNMALEDCWEWL